MMLELKRELPADPRCVPKSIPISLEDPIEKHVAWAFEQIYAKPYPPSRRHPPPADPRIARVVHGIQHVARAASYVPVLVNLYRRYGDEEALALTEEDVKLLQIAALLHDAARLDELDDLWDKQSGEIVFHYLHDILKVAPAKARLLANAVALKDSAPPKNISQKIVHDADCLDIVRATPAFDARFLDFYQHIASNNKDAFADMTELIREVGSLVELQGDGYETRDITTKLRYEDANAYTTITHDIFHGVHDWLPDEKHAGRSRKQLRAYPLLAHLSFKLLTPEELSTIVLIFNRPDKSAIKRMDRPLHATNPDFVIACMERGEVFFRGMPIPAATRKKHVERDHKKDGLETLAAVELRKADRPAKGGNPGRSVSTPGFGASLYCSAGYLIIDEALEGVQAIYLDDINSGFGKKKWCKNLQQAPDILRKKQQELLQKQKMGGGSQKSPDLYLRHNEVLYRIRKFHAVCYTPDPNFSNAWQFNEGYRPFHRYTPVLEAIFLQYEHYNKHQAMLPIYEYSAKHDYLVARQFTPTDIVTMWVEICEHYLLKKCENQEYVDIRTASIEAIKINSLYPNRGRLCLIHSYLAADSNYPAELRKQINTAITAKRQKILDGLVIKPPISATTLMEAGNCSRILALGKLHEKIFTDAAINFVVSFNVSASINDEKSREKMATFCRNNPQYPKIESLNTFFLEKEASIDSYLKHDLLRVYYVAHQLLAKNPKNRLILDKIHEIKTSIHLLCLRQIESASSLQQLREFITLTVLFDIPLREGVLIKPILDKMSELLATIHECLDSSHKSADSIKKSLRDLHQLTSLMAYMRKYSPPDMMHGLEEILASTVLAVGEKIAVQEKLFLLKDDHSRQRPQQELNARYYTVVFDTITQQLREHIPLEPASAQRRAELYDQLIALKKHYCSESLASLVSLEGMGIGLAVAPAAAAAGVAASPPLELPPAVTQKSASCVIS